MINVCEQFTAFFVLVSHLPNPFMGLHGGSQAGLHVEITREGSNPDAEAKPRKSWPSPEVAPWGSSLPAGCGGLDGVGRHNALTVCDRCLSRAEGCQMFARSSFPRPIIFHLKYLCFVSYFLALSPKSSRGFGALKIKRTSVLRVLLKSELERDESCFSP